MNRHSMRWMLRTACILVVLFLALAQTAPVFAEGEEPAAPPPCEGADCPAPVEETPPCEGVDCPAPVDEAPLCEGEGCPPAADETPAPPEEQPTAETPAEAPTEAPPELGEVVDTLAENEAVLVSESGEEIPLADPQAAELLAADDPWFISGTVKYRFVSGACPAPDPAPALTEVCTGGIGVDTIQYAFNYIRDHATIPNDKTIYLEGVTFTPSAVITVDGSQPNIASVTKLQGVGSDNLGAAGTYTQINGRIFISNMPNGFTIKGIAFVLNNASPTIRADNNGGTLKLEDVKVQNSSGSAVDISNHRGAVEIKYLTVPVSGANGVRVDNTAGSGNVSIFSASIIDSSQYGLEITTNGSLTLDGMYVYSNTVGGANIIAKKGVTIRNSIFNDNGFGVTIQPTTKGAVLFSNVWADSNNGDNLSIESSGAVTLENIFARYSSGQVGVYIDNCQDGGTARCTTASGAVTLRNVTATLNFLTNVFIRANGAVSADLIVAEGSTEMGLDIRNEKALSAAAVSLKRINASHNLDTGISVHTRGSITLDGFTTTNNYGNVYLGVEGTTASVTIKASYPYGNQSSYSIGGYPGVFISCNGTVNITGTSSSYNDSYGIEVNAGNGSVTITGKPTLGHSTDGNDDDGIHVITKGSITITDMDAQNNDGNGLNLDNHEGTGSVKVIRGNYISNRSNGIYISTTGSVTVTGANAQYNYESGLLIGNAYPRKQPVTITGGYFGSNASGIFVSSAGTVTIKDIQAADNSLHYYSINYDTQYSDYVVWGEDRWSFMVSSGGFSTTIIVRSKTNTSATLYNPSGFPVVTNSGTDYKLLAGTLTVDPDPYFVLVSSTSGATPYSLWLRQDSHAEPAVTGTWAGNVLVDNTGGTGSVTVTGVKGDYNNFGYSADAAVSILTNGAVTLANISSMGNGADGIQIIGYGAGKTVNLSAINIQHAEGTGISIIGTGPVTLSEVMVTQSGSTGIRINTSGNVSVSGNKTYWNNIANNAGRAIDISTQGNISVANFYIYNNTHGMVLVNTSGTGSVSISNVNLSNNSIMEISVQSHGAVSLSGVDVSSAVRAVEIINIYTTPKTVTIKNLGISTASSTGLEVSSSGSISLSGVTVYDVTYPSAVRLDNTYGTSGGITISNSSVNGSTGTGFFLTSNGNISLSGVSSRETAHYGIYIDNNDLYARTISLKDVQVRDTGTEGIYLEGGGAITLTNISVRYVSGTYAIYLVNGSANVTVNRTGSGQNIISENDHNGLYIYTNGAVSVDRVVAENNTAGTALLVNNQSGSGKFTLTNSYFYSNYNSFNVVTTGAVKMDGVTIDSSVNYGGSLSLNTAKTPSLVIQRSQFGYSHLYGLDVFTYGPVTLNGVSAVYNNAGPGMRVVVNDSGAVNILSSYGANTFSNNGGDGLIVDSNGKITASNLVAIDNIGLGINLDSNSSIGETVTVSGATLQWNEGGGMRVIAQGPVSLTKVNATWNGTGTTGNGVTVISNGYKVSIYTSSALTNRASGFHITLGGGVLYLSNVSYAGNNRGGGTYDPDLKVVP